MAQTFGIRFLLALIAYTVSFQFCSAQKKETITLPADSIVLNAPEVTINNNCKLGTTSLIVTLSEDTNYRFSHVNLYKLREDISPIDSIADTLALIKKVRAEDLLKQGFEIIPQSEGYYTVKAIYQNETEKLESEFSVFARVTQCSELLFKSDFDKLKENYFTPSKLVNIQIKEFNIFDRVGATVYSHQNNDIAWKGTFQNGQKCPNGIYYYHCEYLDISKNGEKKTLSGMIELKNN